MHYLLQHPLPKINQPLPPIWLVQRDTSNRDEVALGIKGLSKYTHVVPRDVLEAAEEYWRLGLSMWKAKPSWDIQMEVLLGLWLLYLREQEYVDFEPVTTSAVTHDPYISNQVSA